MRKLALPFVVLLASCVGAPAYQATTVSLAPTYRVTERHATPLNVADSCPTDSTVAMPATSVHFTRAVATAPFWRDLHDSVLTALIEEALRANTDVRIAESRLTSTRAARRLAALDLAPTITASGSAVRQQLSLAQLPGATRQFPAQQLWDVGFDASWELDLFGRVSRNVRAQGAFVASAEHDVGDVQVSVAAEVARTYFELRGAQQQFAVAQRNSDNQRRTVALTQDRLAAGRGTAFDTERARSVLYLTLATMPGRFTALGDRHAGIDEAPGSLDRLLELSARQEREGLGDAPWPPHYKKQAGEPPRVQPSRARAAKHPLIEVARAKRKLDALAGLKRWKARHKKAAAFLEPADILVDRMRGRSSTWTRIRVNLQHVPAKLRPRQERLDPDEKTLESS
jgi:hypothetical protein